MQKSKFLCILAITSQFKRQFWKTQVKTIRYNSQPIEFKSKTSADLSLGASTCTDWRCLFKKQKDTHLHWQASKDMWSSPTGGQSYASARLAQQRTAGWFSRPGRHNMEAGTKLYGPTSSSSWMHTVCDKMEARHAYQRWRWREGSLVGDQRFVGNVARI